MRTWIPRVVLLLAVAVLAFWVWRTFFPDPQTAIRRRLTEIAQLASFDQKESETAKLWNSEKLASYFTEDVTIKVDVPGAHGEASGRDQIAAGALEARKRFARLGVRFSEIQVTVAPDRQSAIADLTVNANANGEPDFIIQELALRLKKIGRSWLVSRIETVKTLR